MTEPDDPAPVLRYVIRCAGCGKELEIVPEQLADRLAVCPSCGQANPTPIFRVLAGDKRR